MPPVVDLVADVGEGYGAYRMGDDEALLELVTSANVACGFHAGDPRVMDATVRACVRHGVSVGAHPGFPDLAGFGRRMIDLSFDEVRTDTLYQLGALHAFATAHGTRLRHVTPHGRLGNLVVTDRRYALAVAEAVASFDPALILVAQEGELLKAGRELGIPVAALGLADRAYADDGTLVPRAEPGAVITDAAQVTARAVRMAREGVVTTTGGRDLEIACDSILLHGDTADAVELARGVGAGLAAAGVELAPLPRVLGLRADRQAAR